MALYVGLDVSLRTISICIVEARGKMVWEGALRGAGTDRGAGGVPQDAPL